MKPISIRESGVQDVYRIVPLLREEDKAEAIKMGYCDARIALRKSFKNGLLRRTYLIDGQPVAMSGMSGGMLSDIGYPYLVTTPVCDEVPLAFVRIGRDAVEEMMKYRERLEGVVDASYDRAVRFISLIGFSLSGPQPFGPKGHMFHKYFMVR